MRDSRLYKQAYEPIIIIEKGDLRGITLTSKLIYIVVLGITAILGIVLYFSQVIELYAMVGILGGSTILMIANAYEIQHLKTVEAARLIEKGEELYNHRELGNALKTFEKALKISPNNYEAVLGIGQCYRMRTEYEKAVEYFRRAAQLKPKGHEAHFFIGMIHLQNERYGDALESFQMVESLRPDDIEDVYYLMGELFDKMGDYGKALEYFQYYLDRCVECRMRAGVIGKMERISRHHDGDASGDDSPEGKDEDMAESETSPGELVSADDKKDIKPVPDKTEINEAGKKEEPVDKSRIDETEGEVMENVAFVEHDHLTGESEEYVVVNGLKIRKETSENGLTKVVDGIKVKVPRKFGASILERDGARYDGDEGADSNGRDEKVEKEEKSAKASPMGARATARLMGMAKKRKPQMLNLEVQIGVKPKARYDKPTIRAAQVDEEDKNVMLNLTGNNAEKVHQLLEKQRREKDTSPMDSGDLRDASMAMGQRKPLFKSD